MVVTLTLQVVVMSAVFLSVIKLYGGAVSVTLIKALVLTLAEVRHRRVQEFVEEGIESEQTLDEMNSLHWVAPITNKQGALMRVDKGFLEEDLPKSLRDEVSARFHMNSGKIRVASLAAERRMTRDGDKKVQIYNFGGTRRQAAATVVELNMWVDADEIFLVKRPFDTEDPNWDQLILGPNRGKQSGERDDLVEIWIMNEEPDSIYQQRPTSGRRVSVDERNRQELQILQSLATQNGGKGQPPKRETSRAPEFQPDDGVIEDDGMRSQLFTLHPGETGQGSSCRPARSEEEVG